MIPTLASAILLLPSGHRAYDEDFTVEFPVPHAIDVSGDQTGVFRLVHIHHSAQIDDTTRAIYVLGGTYLPNGYAHVVRHNPDELHDQ